MSPETPPLPPEAFEPITREQPDDFDIGEKTKPPTNTDNANYAVDNDSNQPLAEETQEISKLASDEILPSQPSPAETEEQIIGKEENAEEKEELTPEQQIEYLQTCQAELRELSGRAEEELREKENLLAQSESDLNEIDQSKFEKIKQEINELKIMLADLGDLLKLIKDELKKLSVGEEKQPAETPKQPEQIQPPEPETDIGETDDYGAYEDDDAAINQTAQLTTTINQPTAVATVTLPTEDKNEEESKKSDDTKELKLEDETKTIQTQTYEKKEDEQTKKDDEARQKLKKIKSNGLNLNKAEETIIEIEPLLKNEKTRKEMIDFITEKMKQLEISKMKYKGDQTNPSHSDKMGKKRLSAEMAMNLEKIGDAIAGKNNARDHGSMEDARPLYETATKSLLVALQNTEDNPPESGFTLKTYIDNRVTPLLRKHKKSGLDFRYRLGIIKELVRVAFIKRKKDGEPKPSNPRIGAPEQSLRELNAETV